jgi:hypothetical protein
MELSHLMVIRGLLGPPGQGCRRCSQPIDRSDRFGLSERVCGPCRRESRGRPERRAPRPR